MSKQIEIPQLSYALQADWHDGQSSDQIILTFVGFGSSKKSNHDFAAKLVEMTGASALVIDLSGHGESPFDINKTTPAQHLLEATRVYDWLKKTTQIVTCMSWVRATVALSRPTLPDSARCQSLFFAHLLSMSHQCSILCIKT